MLTKKEKQLLEEGQLKQELDDIQSKKSRQNDDLLPKNSKLLPVLFIIIAAVIIAIAVLWFIQGFSSNFRRNIDGFPVYMVASIALAVIAGVILFFALRGLFKRRRKFGQTIMVAPDGEVPDYPEETIATKAVERLEEDFDRPQAVKRIFSDDPEKRAIRMDKKKVERILDHNITFPKLAKAITISLSRFGLGIEEDEAKLLAGKFASSRLFFIRGIDAEHHAPFISALAEAMEGECATVGATPSLPEVYGNVVPPLPANKAFLLGIDGLTPETVEAYIGNYADEIADYSIDHVKEDGNTIWMNLCLFVFLPEGPVNAIPAKLLEKSSTFTLNLNVLPAASTDAPFPVRSSGDEIRYLALREKATSYLSDELVDAFEHLYAFAAKKGFRVHNDVENAFEKEEAALLLQGMSSEKAAGIVVATSYLPYLLAVTGESAFGEEGGLREELERGFSAEECSLPIRQALRELRGEKGGKK